MKRSRILRFWGTGDDRHMRIIHRKIAAMSRAGDGLAAVLLLDMVALACEREDCAITVGIITESYPRWADERKALIAALARLENLGCLVREDHFICLDADRIHEIKLVALPLEPRQ